MMRGRGRRSVCVTLPASNIFEHTGRPRADPCRQLDCSHRGQASSNLLFRRCEPLWYPSLARKLMFVFSLRNAQRASF